MASRSFAALRRLVQLACFACLAFILISVPAEAGPTTRDPQILAFGDSLTSGYGLKASESFPVRLQALLRAEGIRARVVNAGVSGDTTASGKARLDRVLNGLKRKPDLAILQLGSNDMLTGQNPQATEANLDAILVEFRKRGIPVLLAGMFSDQPVGFTYFDRYNGIYPRLARKHSVTLYPFFMKDVAFNRPLLLDDGLHPNARGVSIMARNILPAVRTELQKRPALKP